MIDVPLWLLSSASILVLLALIVAGMPIAFSLLLTGFLGMIVVEGPRTAMATLSTIPYSSVTDFLFTAVPLFIIMGHFAFIGGLAEKAYSACFKLVGQLRGGLSMASVIACGIFSATSGSSVATAATVGKAAIPEMEIRGYDGGFACGAIAAGGTLGILIPPSIVLVVYGIITDESIGRLLLAGFIPGILSTLNYMFIIWLSAKLNPKLAPTGPSYSILTKLKAIPSLWGVIILFVVVMGGIYFGWATPTEAAALGALSAMLLALPKILKKWSLFSYGLWDTIYTVSMVFLIIIGASIFSLFMTSAGILTSFTEFIVNLSIPKFAILFLILIWYIPLGMFFDSMSILLITVPLVYPVLTALGYDGVWLGIIIVKLIEIGLITPPLGMNVFIMKGVAPHIPIEDMFKNILVFVIGDLFFIALLVAFPGIVMWLPNLAK